MVFVLKKEDLQRFIDILKRDYAVVAPVEKGSVVVFDKIDFAGEAVLYEHTDYPPKKYFFPFREQLFKFNRDKVSCSSVKDKFAVLGLRQYDLDAIAVLDKLFLEEPADPYYKRRRESNLLVGYHSDDVGDHCFCTNFPPNRKVFDLMFYYDGEKFIVEVGSEKGRLLVKNSIFRRTNAKIRKKNVCTRVVDDRKDFMRFFDSSVWKKYSDKCLACGACTVVCPTCACFAVDDEVNVDLMSGFRQRTESSCLLRDFTRVAGDSFFREDIASRYKQRYLHKLQYFREQYGISMCTGCGRCAKACPSKICNMVEVVDEL